VAVSGRNELLAAPSGARLCTHSIGEAKAELKSVTPKSSTLGFVSSGFQCAVHSVWIKAAFANT
jgi:hypothetical protein